MKSDEILHGTQQYLMSNYGRLPVALAKAQGARVWDANGKEYIDLFAGFGAAAVGHCHPNVVRAVQDQAATLMAVGNLFHWEAQVELARRIVANSFEAKVFFCQSGTEANEAAMKLARKVAGPGRYKIISFLNCFHGRTMGGLSMTSQKKFHEGFEPMVPGCIYLPFMDLGAVERAIDSETCAIIVEPIQGEGGVNVPSPEYMRGLRRLCDEHRLSLIADEVWTAPARTGKWFGYQHFGITPDIMTLGKAIGGGLPVAACIARPDWAEKFVPGTHGSTLGGNPVCAAAGAAVMRTIEQDNLVERAERLGRRIVRTFTDAKLSRIKEIRGKGLMLGIELDAPAKGVFDACLERGVMLNVTQGNVIRVAPPMTIEEDRLDRGLGILVEALRA